MREKNIDDYRREFYQVYHREILPKLEVFERTRKSKFGQLLFYEITVASVLAVLLMSSGYIRGLYYEIACVLLVLALIIIPYFMNKNFVKMLKKECMHSLTKVFGEVEWANDQQFITDTELVKSELFSTYNRRGSDDSFKGKYNGVNFVISETKLVNQTGSGKNRRRRTIFKGIIINFESNKTIRNKTIITTKWDMHTARMSKWMFFSSILPLFAYIYLFPELKILLIAAAALAIIAIFIFFSKGNGEALDEVNLEDPVFEKKFNVYSSDQVEARYLITTAFMERFNNLNTAFGAKKAKCSFFDNTIMFAISTHKNLFEIGNLFMRLDDPNRITKFFNEIASILILVDYFKLDEHIKL